MSATNDTLNDLTRCHPEWKPWLGVVAQVLTEIRQPEWEAAVPDAPMTPVRGVPLLAGANLRAPGRVGPLFEALRQSAAASGAPVMAGLQAVPCSQAGACEVFRAVLNDDDASLAEFAAHRGVDGEAMRAVAALLPMPFLHACGRRWARVIAPGWSHGYCPCCGAWPALAEVCGIERSRYLRCGRCGTAWQAACLACPYCGMTDHRELASMVPEPGTSKSVIEVCKRCLGYVKVAARLQPSPPATVMLDDLASVEYDLAAAGRGYARPDGVGYALRVTLLDAASIGPLAGS